MGHINMRTNAYILVILLLVLDIYSISIQAGGEPKEVCARVTKKFDLMKFKAQAPVFDAEQQGVLDAGDGVSLVLAPLKDGEHNAQFTVQDRGKKVAAIKTSQYFTACFSLEAGKARYWVVEAWTGGAHCCFTHYYFCRPQEGMAVRALGKVELGHAQEEDDGDNLGPSKIVCLQVQPYLRYLDTRFAYFGTSFAQSGEMFFPDYYQLSPEGLQLSNQYFKEEYRREIARFDKAIAAEAATLKSKPQRIGSIRRVYDDIDVSLSGKLAILLTARTIHYLVAREDDLAWTTLERDVKNNYQTTEGLDDLKKAIKASMAESPY